MGYFLMVCLMFAFCPLEGKKALEEKSQYKVAICAFFQNEAPYLKEWLEYHLLIGVEHFYLFNNDSDDDYLTVLEPYLSQGVVELSDWPSAVKGESWLGDQRNAYNDCIQNCVGICSWLAIIDIDEFIVPVDQPNLVAFLSKFDNRPNVGAIKINWQLYGTSFLPALPKDRLMIESLTWKAPTDYAWERPNNTVVKSIVRPEAVKLYRIHEGDYKAKYHAVPKNGSGVFQPVQIDQIRINHYWTRAEDYFCEVKIGRRLRFTADGYEEIMMQKLHDLNQVEDKIIYKFVPELRERLAL